MTVQIRTITFDCTDPYAQVVFWSQVTGYTEDPTNPNAPEDPEGFLLAPEGVPNLLFIRVPESKTVKNRVHLDVAPTDRTRDEEVARLTGAGLSNAQIAARLGISPQTVKFHVASISGTVTDDEGAPVAGADPRAAGVGRCGPR